VPYASNAKLQAVSHSCFIDSFFAYFRYPQQLEIGLEVPKASGKP